MMIDRAAFQKVMDNPAAAKHLADLLAAVAADPDPESLLRLTVLAMKQDQERRGLQLSDQWRDDDASRN